MRRGLPAVDRVPEQLGEPIILTGVDAFECEKAINAALKVVRDAVNGALPFKLL